MTDSTKAPRRWAMVLTTRGPSRDQADTIEARWAKHCRKHRGSIVGIMYEDDADVPRYRRTDDGKVEFSDSVREKRGLTVFAAIPVNDLPDADREALSAAVADVAPGHRVAVFQPEDCKDIAEMRFIPHALALYIGSAQPSVGDDDPVTFHSAEAARTPQIVHFARERHEARILAAFYEAMGLRTIPLDTESGIPTQKWANGQDYRIKRGAFAVVTGEQRVVGLDLDCKGGVDGVAAMADLGWPIDDLETLQADTPTGGVHVYVRWPEDLPMMKSTASKIALGVDTRGRGGQLRAIGSTLDKGAYTVRRAAPIAECPRELAELILERTEPKKSKPEPRAKSVRRPKSHRAGRAGLEALVQRMLDTGETGESRHKTLISVGTSAAMYHGVPGMRAARMAAETTGLDDAEIERTLSYAAGYAGLDDPVMAAEEAMDVEDDDEDE